MKKKSSARSNAPANRLRIIGGRWRGTPIEFPALAAIRPSPDRVRETLFNWLQTRIVGARCLDLFAGSGALGLEALSRGAAHTTFVDREPQIGAHLTRVLQRLNASGGQVCVMDAERFLAQMPQPYDIVFLDPPFATGVLQQVCAALANGWLASGAWVYLEQAAVEPLPALPTSWSVHRAKRAGQVGYHLLRVN